MVMIFLLLLTLAGVAYIAMVGFTKMGWVTANYENDKVPYSLGIFVLYTFVVFGFFISTYTEVFSAVSVLYLVGVWLTGLIDDIFGEKSTKGIKGHVKKFLLKGIVSTGMLKLIGTAGLTVIVLIYLQPVYWDEWVRYSLLLLLTPHIINLFDTRPLRVWKVSLLYVAFTLPLFSVFSFSIYLYILTFFFIFYVFDGHKIAMLGDNGATLIGGIIALITIFHMPAPQQWLLIAVFLFLTILAERFSFSRWIEKSKILQMIDEWGVHPGR